MLRGIYLVYSSLNMDKPGGIERKIISQIKLFEDCNISMTVWQLKKNKGTFWNYDHKISNVDFVYFRRSTVIDFHFVKFFKKLKKDNPKIIVMMEIPTFPYEGEYKANIKNKILLAIDRYHREKLKGLLDYIVIVGNYTNEKIWGINAITIVNGIDVSEIKQSRREYSSTITISCIAKFSPWHGYERLINGMNKYYKEGGKRELRIYMVGDGIELQYYKDLVGKYKLGDKVLFTGLLIGDELEKIYDETDIGCCSLGRYKSGLNVIGDLKSREFMAKGIPMITGCDIDILQKEKYPYVIKFPNDDSYIDLNKVIYFYDKLTEEQSAEVLHNNIRSFAYKLADLRNTYKPVLDTVANIDLRS